MEADAEPERFLRQVRDVEAGDGGHEFQSHEGDLTAVLVVVALGETAHHHVGITNRLHLQDKPHPDRCNTSTDNCPNYYRLFLI